MAIGTALPVVIPGAAIGTVRYAPRAARRVGRRGGHRPARPRRREDRGPALGPGARQRPRPPARHRGPARHLVVPDGQAAIAGRAGGALGRVRRARRAGRAASTATARSRATPAIGVVAGLLSGLLGIGGGVIMVPAFVRFAGLQVKSAIATSLCCVGAARHPRCPHPPPAGAHRRAGGAGPHPRRHPRRPDRRRR